MIRIHEHHAGLVVFLSTRSRRYIIHEVSETTWRFRRYGPGTLQALLACEVAALRRDRRQFWGALTCAGLALLALRCGIAYFHGNLEFVWGLLSVFAWLGLLAWLAYSTEQRITRKRMEKLVRLLQRHEAPESVGALIDALATGDCAATTPVLIALLPRLCREDALVLDSRRRAALYRTLHSHDPELVLAILKAFEQVGDDRAISHVKRLTACRAWTPDHDRIEAAARQCLRILIATAGERQSQRLLLRTASAPAAMEKELLHTAQEPAYVPVVQLLRAVHEPLVETREDITKEKEKEKDR